MSEIFSRVGRKTTNIQKKTNKQTNKTVVGTIIFIPQEIELENGVYCRLALHQPILSFLYASLR